MSGPGVIPRIAEATTNTASWAGSGTVLLPYLFTANAKAPRSEIVETRRKMNRRVQAEAGIKGAGEGAQRPDEAQPDDQRGDGKQKPVGGYQPPEREQECSPDARGQCSGRVTGFKKLHSN